MGKFLSAGDQLWEEQQRILSIQKAREFGELLRDFILVIVLIVLTIAVSTLLSNLFGRVASGAEGQS